MPGRDGGLTMAGCTAGRAGSRAALVLFILVYAVGMLDRSILTVLLQPIKREFHLSDTELGFVSGLAFSVAYGLAAVPVGMLADRYSRRWLLAGAVLVWSGLTVISGFAHAFLALCLARLGVGLMEAGQPPLVMSLVGDTIAPGRRTGAISMIYLGVPVGALLGFLVAGKVAAQHGWRVALMGAGAPGLLLAPAILLLLHEPTRGAWEARPAPGTSSLDLVEGWRNVAACPALVCALAAAGLSSVVSSAMSVWIPSLLMRRLGVDLAVVGPALAVSAGVCGIAGAVIGGGLSNRIVGADLASTARAIGVMAALMVPIALAAFASPSMPLILIANGAFNILIPCFLAGLHALCIGLCAPRARGFVVALLAIMLTLVGYGLGSQAIGAMSDAYARSGLDQPLSAALSTAVSAMALAALLLWRAAVILRRSGGGPGQLYRDASAAAVL